MRVDIFAGALFIVAAMVAVNYFDRDDQADKPVEPAQSLEEESKEAEKRRAFYSGEVRIPAGRNNQFYVDGKVNNRSQHFLIDTGASYVALRESEALRAGVRVYAQDFKYKISTANGTIKAARATVKELDVKGIRVKDVEAFIIPDDKLDINLLGMSYLSRIDSIRTEKNQMVLKG